MEWDIKELGSNYTSEITKWYPYVNWNKGKISVSLNVKFCDENDDVIHERRYYDNALLEIKKENGIWGIYDVSVIP